ncbi:MAG: helix-hairpin-helix domain-containing protein [Myxococcota bacterium]
MRNRIVRGAAAGAAAGLLMLLSGGFAGSAERASRQPETRLVGVVNVNTATAEQLQLLPGIGPARAAAILEFRKAGKLKRVEELTEVSGIGEVALERIRPHVAVSGKTTARPLE